MRPDQARSGLLVLFLAGFLCGAVGTVPAERCSLCKCMRLKGGEAEPEAELSSDDSAYYHSSQWDSTKILEYQQEKAEAKRASKIKPVKEEDPKPECRCREVTSAQNYWYHVETVRIATSQPGSYLTIRQKWA
jgi:hypothetical protein